MKKPNTYLLELASTHPEHAEGLSAVTDHIDGLRSKVVEYQRRLEQIEEFARLASGPRPCVHDWHADPGSPLIDICSKCGEERA